MDAEWEDQIEHLLAEALHQRFPDSEIGDRWEMAWEELATKLFTRLDIQQKRRIIDNIHQILDEWELSDADE